ncbi:MAG: phosphomannomutase/phosphoglucomutase [Bacteroidales bacterium]
MGAFHAYDIRGIYNVDFNRNDVYRIGYFLPKLLGSDKILIGRDVRESSPEIREWLIRGILDSGAHAYDIGESTTPMLYFATVKLNFSASVQITASHNPKEYNGLKVSREDAIPVGFDTGLGKLKEMVEGGRVIPVEANKRGELHMVDIRRDYIAFLESYKVDLSNLRCAIDLSNGMVATLIKDLLGEESESLLYLFDTPDGTFPNHDPNPLDPKNIVDLQRKVIQNSCDIGVIFDGDGDRVMFVDESGRFISPDLIIALMAHYFVEERNLKGAVLQDIRSSKSIKEYLEPFGVELHTWKVGRAFAALKLRELDGVWGGELAGHYYFREFFYSDSGLMAALIVLRVVSKMKERGVSLSSLISKIELYHNSGEINFKIQKKQEAMDAVKEYFLANERAVATFDFDGYRVEFDQWWFNIRPSNTEPYLRFLAEAKSKSILDSRVEKVKELLAHFQ